MRTSPIRFSRCRNCGKEIIWAKKKDGGYHRPLVLNDTASILIDENGIVSEDFVSTYKLHRCDPEDVENYKDTAQEEFDRRREYEESLVRTRTEALKHPCSKCGAAINEACINLNKKKKGTIEKVVWPHPERIPKNALGD